MSTNNVAFVKITWTVKFRILMVTLGTYTDTRVIPLPNAVSLVQKIVGTQQLYSYNNHGVNVLLTLQDSAIA